MEDACLSVDTVLYKKATNQLTKTKEIKIAKGSYAENLKKTFSASDSASVWKGLQSITNFMRPSLQA